MDSQQSNSSAPVDMAQFNNQCVDPTDLSNFIDFNHMNSPAGSSKLPLSTSSMTSPVSALSQDMNDDHLMMRPSHDYGRFKQQTGLPIQADLSVLGQSQMFQGYNTGIYDQSWDMGMQSEIMDPNLEALLAMSTNDDFIDPNAIMKQEHLQANIRYFPGMHQQVAAQKQAMMAKQKQREADQRQQVQAPVQAPRRSVSSQPLDARTEETISRVMSEIRRSSNMAADSVSNNGNNMLPHVIRAKRDEDEMDEDERLLNSEEGKKLSSKERRQLRNKVSARAFRSRRKEYITQLEGELSNKANECQDYKHANQMLMEENARYRALAEKLLAHAAFQPFLEDLSRDPDLVASFSKVTSTESMVSQPQMPKDMDSFSNSQQQYPPPQTNTHVGMTMIPEIPVDLSSLQIGSNNQWNAMHGLPHQNMYQPSVFTVELPAGPSVPIDFSVLSGKVENVLPELSFVEEKREYSEIQTMPTQESEESSFEAEEFDENDPAFALYASSRSTKSAPSTLEFESILSAPAFEKATAHFELVSCDQDGSMSLQFERMTATLDTSCRRLESIMSSF